MTGERIVVAAPAKVNLYLAVGGARPDGYHDVLTVMQALELHDVVTLEPAAELSVTCEPDLGVPAERNLAVRAALALGDRFGRTPAVAIHLRKHVPVGAGLGGGSSDAAAVLAGLALAWDLEAADPALVEVAAALGADVPFFLTGGCALLTGRGDVLVRALPVPPLHIALVNPGVPVSTAEAYAAFDAAAPEPAPGPEALLAAIEAADPAAVASALSDNLTGPVAGLVPAVADALAFISGSSGLLGACMAGSGSSVFGIFADAPSAEAAASRARERGWWAAATRSRETGVAPIATDGREEGA